MKRQSASVLCLLVGLATAGPAAAGAQSDFGVLVFSGYAIAPPGVGQTLTVLARLVNRPGAVPPLPLDFVSQEHTLLIVATLRNIVPGTHLYGDATIAIYSDSVASGTAADYNRPDTFVDGELILSGGFDTLGRYLEPTATIFGHLVWTEGSRLQELAIAPCVLTGSWEPAVGIPPDYNQAWSCDLRAVIDAVETRSWSAVRQLYR
jgi:hypothetical protein